MGEKYITTISIRRDIAKKADELVEQGIFAGISDRSSLIEYALVELFKTIKEVA